MYKHKAKLFFKGVEIPWGASRTSFEGESQLCRFPTYQYPPSKINVSILWFYWMRLQFADCWDAYHTPEPISSDASICHPEVQDTSNWFFADRRNENRDFERYLGKIIHGKRQGQNPGNTSGRKVLASLGICRAPSSKNITSQERVFLGKYSPKKGHMPLNAFPKKGHTPLNAIFLPLITDWIGVVRFRILAKIIQWCISTLFATLFIPFPQFVQNVQ